MPHFIRTSVSVAALLLAATGAQAADFVLSGNVVYQKDVVSIDFTVGANSTNVKIWTDSWQSGLNFDPTATVWSASGALISQVDDDDTVASGQGYYDTGFSFPALAAGNYRLSLTASPNYANGSTLAQGFVYDTQAAIPIAQWNQPSYDPNANDQKGSFWQVHFSGVNNVTAVPEPSTWLLLGAGLAAVALQRRRNYANTTRGK